MRVSGVRKSCEMPAKSVVRFSNNTDISDAIVLKLRANETNSRGPVSANGSIFSSPRNRSACLATLTNGRVTRCTTNNEVKKTIAAPKPTITMATYSG